VILKLSTDFYNLKFKMHQRTTGSKFGTRAKIEGMSKTLQPLTVSMKAIIVYLHGITFFKCVSDLTSSYNSGRSANRTVTDTQ
jgi:hypothetical protein